jgi:hypothetical protein
MINQTIVKDQKEREWLPFDVIGRLVYKIMSVKRYMDLMHIEDRINEILKAEEEEGII